MDRPVVEKVICYVVEGDRLLVIAHLAQDLTVTGVQVPAGTVEINEDPVVAAVRETFEETGLSARVVRELGTATYDLAPTRDEIAKRIFLQLQLNEPAPERWTAGESSPATGGPAEEWECWWIPLRQAHVLAAGLGAQLAKIVA